MIIWEDGFVFDYEAVDSVFEDLKKLRIDDFFVSNTDMKKVSELLNLENRKTEKELRAVRNAFVKKWSDFIEDLPYEEFKKYRNTLSGVTAVIDDYLWKRGFEV